MKRWQVVFEDLHALWEKDDKLWLDAWNIQEQRKKLSYQIRRKTEQLVNLTRHWGDKNQS